MPRAAILVATVGSMALAGCGGGGGSLLSEADEKPVAATLVSGDAGMDGRWILSAPRAPSCGLTLSGGPAAIEGRVTPEGGCPERFFLARRWRMSDGALTVVDGDATPLGSFKAAGDGSFQGRSAGETPLTLSR